LALSRHQPEKSAHFFGAASRAMRDVLVDFARRTRATKRGDIARMLGVSSRTVKRDWLEARLFLLRAMETANA